MSTDPTPAAREPMRVAGFATRTSNAAFESGEGTIGATWQKLMSRSTELAPECAPVGVYFDYESDHNGEYSLLAGYPIAADTTVPDGWEVIDVPGAACLVFSGDGEIPAVVSDTWMRVWKHFDGAGEPKRAFTADVEVFREGGLDIHIATA